MTDPIPVDYNPFGSEQPVDYDPFAKNKLTPIEKDYVARTVLGEAGKEPDQGQEAVARVIRNRLESGQFGGSIEDVVKAPNQFEPWNTPVGRNRMYRYASDSPEYQRAMANVDRAFADDNSDPTGGATHFYAPTAQAAMGRNTPEWARGEPTTVIGGHRFYAPNGKVSAAARDPFATTTVDASAEQTTGVPGAVLVGGNPFAVAGGEGSSTTPVQPDQREALKQPEAYSASPNTAGPSAAPSQRFGQGVVQGFESMVKPFTDLTAPQPQAETFPSQDARSLSPEEAAMRDKFAQPPQVPTPQDFQPKQEKPQFYTGQPLNEAVANSKAALGRVMDSAMAGLLESAQPDAPLGGASQQDIQNMRDAGLLPPPEMFNGNPASYVAAQALLHGPEVGDAIMRGMMAPFTGAIRAAGQAIRESGGSERTADNFENTALGMLESEMGRVMAPEYHVPGAPVIPDRIPVPEVKPSLTPEEVLKTYQEAVVPKQRRVETPIYAPGEPEPAFASRPIEAAPSAPLEIHTQRESIVGDTKALNELRQQWKDMTGETLTDEQIYSKIKEGDKPKAVKVNDQVSGEFEQPLSPTSSFGDILDNAAGPQKARTDPKHDAAVRGITAIANIAKRMGMNAPIRFKFTYEEVFGRMMPESVDGWAGINNFEDLRNMPKERVKGWEIRVNLGAHASPEHVYATVAHEFGHALIFDKWRDTSKEMQNAIRQAYEGFRAKIAANPVEYERLRQVLDIRDNFVAKSVAKGDLLSARLSELFPEQRNYWLSFDEWFAEQIARWATTSEKPLSVVDKFFKGLSNSLKSMYQNFTEALATKSTRTAPTGEAVVDWHQLGLPEPVVKQWLDGMMTQGWSPSHAIYTANDFKSVAENLKSMKASGVNDFPAVEAQPPSAELRISMPKLFGGKEPPEVKASHAAADWWYRVFKYGADLNVIADGNPHITLLQRYRELITKAHGMAEQWHMRAEETLKTGLKLSERQHAAYVKLVDDYINMVFLTADERATGIERRPTAPEFAKLAKDAGADNQVLQFFRRSVMDYDDFAAALHDVLRERASQIPDLAEQARALNAIDASEDAYMKKPYAPALRYGKYAVNIYGPDGATVEFYRFETLKDQKRAMRLLTKSLKEGERIQPSILPDSAYPFMGLPPKLMDLIAKRLDLSPEQQKALQQLRYEMAPGASFQHRLQNRSLMGGYSRDFMRGYSHYFFHGARYLSKVAHADELRQMSEGLWHSVRFAPDGNKRSAIAQFVADHLEQAFLNPRGDWAIPRIFAYHMFLGYKAAAASMNLSQTLISTQPFLGATFGDAKAAKAIMDATKNFKNFYKEDTLKRMTAPEQRALAEGIRLGDVKGTLATELAGLSEGRNLLRQYGGNAAQRAANAYLKGSSYLFSITEQANRRVSFMSAWRLAMDEPHHPFVKQAVEQWRKTYEDLLERGFNEQEAAAIVTGRQVTRVTQGDYSSFGRPRFMQGKAGSAAFVFKMFQYKMLMNMWTFPSTGARMFLTLGFLGGLMGIPGVQDLNGILRTIAYQLFGRDFDLERSARELAADHLTGPLGKYAPDYFAQGLAARGYGIPDLLDLIGEHVGLPRIGTDPTKQQFVPAPVFNRGASVGLGNVLPIDPSQVLGPTADADSALRGTSQGGGVLGGWAYNVYKAMSDPTNFRRWERVVPTAFGNVSHAARIAANGGELNNKGNMVMKFDPTDIQDVLELAGLAAGYQPARLQGKWNNIIAQSEVTAYWDITRNTLMTQAWAAKQGGDPDEWNRVKTAIRKFNEGLPQEAKGKIITAETLQKSFAMRQKNKAAEESGVPLQKSNRPIAETINRLYPSADMDVRPEH